MSTTTKWIIGIAIALLVIAVAFPFVWQLAFPNAGYAGGGFGRSPMVFHGRGLMMNGGLGFGMLPLGGLFMFLVQLGVLALIVLGILALVKYLTNKPG